MNIKPLITDKEAKRLMEKGEARAFANNHLMSYQGATYTRIQEKNNIHYELLNTNGVK